MTGLFRGFAPASGKAKFADTLDRAIQRVREINGDNGPIVVTAHPDALQGITAPLGVILAPDTRVPLGNCWVSVGQLGEDGEA